MAEYPEDWFIAWHAPGGASRLDEHVRERVPSMSRERLKDAFAAGRIRIKGEAALPGARADKGVRIEISISADDASAYQAGARGARGFFLLYKDDDIMIVDKAPGVLTVPTDEGEKAGLGQSGEETLVERVADALSVPPRTVIPVHRLDRFTSGTLVLARNAAAKAKLVEQFARHSITRRYLALTRGIPDPAAGTFRSRLESDARRKQHVSYRGELAVTHYEVIEELRGAAVVIAVLETGKRNQIRVHFAEAGWPLVGEHRYAPEKDKELDRQALHAAELEFAHPRSGRPIAAASPMPPDMRRFTQRHRRHR